MVMTRDEYLNTALYIVRYHKISDIYRSHQAIQNIEVPIVKAIQKSVNRAVNSSHLKNRIIRLRCVYIYVSVLIIIFAISENSCLACIITTNINKDL